MMHSAQMSAGASRLSEARAWTRTYPPSAKVIRLSQLRGLRGSEQVAAVCYRVRGGAIEFLLVQTRGGRWIFPKGGAEPGLTRAQAAALEAFEEAGVHGRIEEASFARYVRRKRGTSNDSDAVELTVSAYLCEVLWLDAPQEAGRCPTWFSAQKAKRRLRDGRARTYRADLARVIDSAVAHIQRVHRGTSTFVDSLQPLQVIDGSRTLTPKARRQKWS